VGTMVTVTTTCHNPKCPKKKLIWYSHPYMTDTKIPTGNFILSFAILVAGGSASKVFKIFDHMGLSCIRLSTFFQHQRVNTVLVQAIKFTLIADKIVTILLI